MCESYWVWGGWGEGAAFHVSVCSKCSDGALLGCLKRRIYLDFNYCWFLPWFVCLFVCFVFVCQPLWENSHFRLIFITCSLNESNITRKWMMIKRKKQLCLHYIYIYIYIMQAQLLFCFFIYMYQHFNNLLVFMYTYILKKKEVLLSSWTLCQNGYIVQIFLIIFFSLCLCLYKCSVCRCTVVGGFLFHLGYW